MMYNGRKLPNKKHYRMNKIQFEQLIFQNEI